MIYDERNQRTVTDANTVLIELSRFVRNKTVYYINFEILCTCSFSNLL